MKTLIIIIATIFFLGCKGEDDKKVEKQDQQSLKQDLEAGETVTIAAIGTSLTASGSSTWFYRFVTDLNNKYPEQVNGYNEAIGGSASRYTKAYKQEEIRRGLFLGSGFDIQIKNALAHNPDYLFIEFSMNDSYVVYEISIEASKANLQAIIDLVPSKVIIITQTMNNVAEIWDHTRPGLSIYYQGYMDLASKNDIIIIDHHLNWLRIYDNFDLWNSYVPDGIHPNDKAAEEIIVPNIIESLGLG